MQIGYTAKSDSIAVLKAYKLSGLLYETRNARNFIINIRSAYAIK